MKVVLKHTDKWLHFQCPEKVLRAERVDDVLPMLREAEESGLFAAGFVSYEAAPAFDSALKTKPSEGFPLLCLGLFHAPDVLDNIEEAPSSSYEIGDLKPSVSKAEFMDAIGGIKERIAEGATYQVNYTYRLTAPFSGDAWAFFYELVMAQKTDHAAFVETDGYTVCSASPELFFSFSDGKIVSRPMKGTAQRGRTFAEDREKAGALRESEKDRAENIMIVDMIRNDIGRVAEPGSVEAVSRYDVEKYPTVWQMTSTVVGNVKAGAASAFEGIFKALFPCASVTGAPKAKTMEIIRELETSPRKVYTGSIGFITPQGEASFNVAIRTALIDWQNGQLEYGIGGGVVWDSDAEAEYEETLTKARVLTEPRPDFQLLETMLWEPDDGFFLMNEHLQRLGNSAEYFDIPLEKHEVLRRLGEVVHTCAGVKHRIRLLVSRDGSLDLQAVPMAEGWAGYPHTPQMGDRSVPSLQAALAKVPVNSQDIFLFHKTTHRRVYEAAKAEFPDAGDVILWNERGEVTESTIANVVIRQGGSLVTPPVDCGLLAGVFRGHLLRSGDITERLVTIEDLRAADEIYLVNSVRGWQRAELQQPG